MKLPLELLDVFNWRETGPITAKPVNLITETKVDHIIASMYPAFNHVIQFGVDYHKFMDSRDPVGLVAFIEKYKVDKYGRLATFAKGLEMDIKAVTNALLHPDITNGPVEGKNNLIKCDKRVYGGRAKIDLLTPKALLRQSRPPARESK